MKLLKTLKKQTGFSLVELMVVVAIIGILATVAIPNLRKFQDKARQSEAKTQLASFYTAEEAFRSEYNSFISTFEDLRFIPQGKVVYNVGMIDAAPVTAINGYGTYKGASRNIKQCLLNGTCPGVVKAFDDTAAAIPAGNTVSGSSGNFDTWQAAAIGKLQNTDTWTINQSKVISQTADGL